MWRVALELDGSLGSLARTNVVVLRAKMESKAWLYAHHDTR